MWANWHKIFSQYVPTNNISLTVYNDYLKTITVNHQKGFFHVPKVVVSLYLQDWLTTGEFLPISPLLYVQYIIILKKNAVNHQKVFFLCFKGCSTLVVTRLTYYRWIFANISLTVRTVYNNYLKTITVNHQKVFFMFQRL